MPRIEKPFLEEIETTLKMDMQPFAACHHPFPGDFLRTANSLNKFGVEAPKQAAIFSIPAYLISSFGSGPKGSATEASLSASANCSHSLRLARFPKQLTHPMHRRNSGVPTESFQRDVF